MSVLAACYEQCMHARCMQETEQSVEFSGTGGSQMPVNHKVGAGTRPGSFGTTASALIPKPSLQSRISLCEASGFLRESVHVRV